ncbi:MAG: glutathione S-transferase family protein [Pseudomonadota bacterium]
MYTLYDMQVSGNCYKVRLILSLLGLPFESVMIAPTRGEAETDAMLERNPNGKVPILMLPDSRPLAESNAILLYLAEGTDLLLDDRFARAVVNQWLFFEQYSHEPNIAVRISLMTLPERADQATEERMAALLEGGNRALSVLNRQLAMTPFIAGSDFTVADIALYAYTHEAEEGGFDLAAFPYIAPWLKRVAGRDRFVPIDWTPPLAADR